LRACVLECPQHRSGRLRIFQQEGFGQIELQEARIHAGFGQDGAHAFDKILRTQFRSRNIDSNAQPGQPGVLPGTGLPARFAQDPAPDRQNRAARLGDRNEFARLQQSALRVTPADQRFHAGDRAALQVDLRLIMQRELLSLNRVSEVVFDRK
jgi:hypothetical protein